MTQKILTSILIVFFSHLSVMAKTTCICETGLSPYIQTSAFKIGCDLWLGRQKDCSIKKTVEAGYDYQNELTADKSASTKYKIGYVGHWSSSVYTIRYVNSYFSPLIKNGNTILYDNTACGSQSDANLVQSYLKNLKLRKGQQVTVFGNQTTSIGEWGFFVPNSINFWAVASSELQEPIYPSCNEFRGTSCLHWFQKDTYGICTEPNGSLKSLTCKEQNISDNESYQSKTPYYKWLD